MKPKMYIEHILIDQNNLMINHEDFDKLFCSLLTNMPVKKKSKIQNKIIDYIILQMKHQY